jgi:lysophospholipase L1-like esterase
MSKLCLIAASLVSQGQAPGWQLAVPPAEIPTRTPLATSVAIAQLCENQPAYRAARPAVEVHAPESSRRWQTAPLVVDLTRPGQARPASGSQLYQQRWAALRAGMIYTRISTDRFRNAWINARQQPTYQQWLNLLSREAQALGRAQGPNRLSILVGDSLALWYPIERMTRDRYWLNQGISGDTTTGVLNRLSLFDQTRPNAIHVMAGINDLRRGATDAEVVSNLTQIIRRLKKAHPQASLYIYSILPTRLAAIPNRRLRWLNYNIAAVTRQENVNFLNLQTVFSDDEGNLRRDLTTDGLHLSALGYQVWQAALQPLL